MSRNVVIGAVVVVVVVLGWYYFQSQKGGVNYTSPQLTPTATQPEESPATSSAQTVEKNVVNIQSSGFLPKDVTIKVGESVTWVNQDTSDHQVKSAVHPTHLVYPPLNNVDLIKPGEKKPLVFPTAGSYKYHDHLNPSLIGSVTVE